MKRRAKPEDEGPPLTAAQVRPLLEELLQAQSEHGHIHGHPAIHELCELAGGCMAGYYAQASISHPDGPRPLDEMVEHIMDMAPTWARSAQKPPSRREQQ